MLSGRDETGLIERHRGLGLYKADGMGRDLGSGLGDEGGNAPIGAGVAIAALLLGETLGPRDILGVAIIAGGILAVQVSRQRRA